MTKRVHAFGDDALGHLDGIGVASAIAGGEISAAEALEAALTRIDSVEPQLNAVAVDDRDRARRLIVENPSQKGPFAGVPSIIKNNTNYAGIAARHGSAAVSDRPAQRNEPFTDQFLATGVTLVGASTLPAFGLTATTEFVDRPPTRNPWDTDYSAGASSGGSAALVAAGALPIAHANDGGGSIRIPAAACGLVGLKPSRGRVAASVEGEAAPIDLVSNGIVSRSVRDTAHFLADIDRGDAASMPRVGLVEGPSERRLRIGVLDEAITGQPLDADTVAGLQATVELLGELGHDVEVIPIPVEPAFIDQFTDYWGLMAFSLEFFGSRLLDPDFDRSQVDPFTRGLSRKFLRRFYRTPHVIWSLRRSIGRFRAVFRQVDVVLSPTLAHVTPEIGYLDPGIDFDLVFERLIRYVAFTPANNVSGTPAISLPLAQSSAGLPVGIHFSADLGCERVLLELAFELEAARGFARIQDPVG
ncbi:amidase [Gordonia soli]|uniref:amidase n=1 Tax=Gordonia soli NBRC 108243 TaxID=1223545 RepID=M0QRF3_9ACTN|nr:amidase [Gordonia soli]GAC70087.1 putative amidase [Gordonia soli NBRC 108243]